MSESVKWREKGNNLYRTDNVSLPFDERKKILEQAQGCYLNAVDNSKTDDELSSSCKNAAIVSKRLAQFYLDQRKPDNAQMELQIEHNFRLALTHFNKAVTKASCQSEEWMSKLQESMEACFHSAMEWSKTKPTSKRLELTEHLVRVLPEGETKADGFITLATYLFHLAVQVTQDRDFKLAIKYLGDCYNPVEEAKRLTRNSSHHETEITVLEDDIYYHTCVAKSLSAKASGDQIFKDMIEKTETLNMDIVWDTMDWYHIAIMLTRGKDLEIEAELLCKVGNLYDKVLKMKEKAKSAYMSAMNLVQILFPKNLNNTDWFKEATLFLDNYQKERLRELDKREEDEKGPIKKKLKAELDKLENVRNNSIDDVLEFIYKTWPPKKKENMAKRGSPKRRLQRAIHCYHPDTQDKEKHGMKWFVMAEEITKVLTEKYNVMKGAD